MREAEKKLVGLSLYVYIPVLSGFSLRVMFLDVEFSCVPLSNEGSGNPPWKTFTVHYLSEVK